jgi:nicotinate-nucleotide adenylyltransferase
VIHNEEKEMKDMMKVGIMGGTFNPIHNGHLLLAENAYEQMGLDKVLFMPSKNPPHKNKTNIVADEDRLAMVALAIQDNPHFTLSTMEMEREGITYTADTLSILTEKNPQIEYYFIIGADSLFMLETWKDPKTIFHLCTILIANRNLEEKENLEQQIRHLNSVYNEAHIILLTMPVIEVSSAWIRARIAEHKSIRYVVPKEVMLYMETYNLYVKQGKELN